MSRRRFFQAIVAAVITLCVAFTGVLSAQGNSDAALERVKQIQERTSAKLMAKNGVVGTAIGRNSKGRYTILLLLDRSGIGGLPNELEGVPVQPIVTGKIEKLAKPSASVNPKSWFTRPVPIGVSTGNEGECSAGTIGCRVKDSAGTVYALSNNHVYALENNAPIPSNVLQPGRYDTACATDLNNKIGALFDFVKIDFSGAVNKVDAAIALSSTGDLGNATPGNGYGLPKSADTLATVNMPVQKYGRTSSLTKGTITGINGKLNVGYSNGTAYFENQIIVQSRTAFIKAGDSGSLLVTNPGRQPVGLLFAGNSSGTYAVANQIADVLSAFKVSVTVDGE